MQQWHYPYEVRKQMLAGGALELAYIDEGPGTAETLLMIHGLGTNLKSFAKMIAALRSRYRCIAIDLPGYGKSSQKEYPFSMAFFADAIAAFLEALDLRGVTAVGHSMGGQIALHLAHRRPGLVDKLVLLAPAGFEQFQPADRLWFERVYDLALLENLPTGQIVYNFHLNFFRFPKDAEFMIEDRLLLRSHTQAYRYFCRMVAQCVRAMLSEPVYNLMPDIRQPALVFFGRDDQLIPNRWLHPTLTVAQVAQAGAMRLPKGEVHLLPACGHFPQWERTDLIKAELEVFA